MLLILNLDDLPFVYFYWVAGASVVCLCLAGAIRMESILFNLDLALLISFLLCYFILFDGEFMKLSILC